MQTYHPTGFTLGEFELKILTKELMATGKTRSEIVRGLIADLGRKQAKQNKAAQFVPTRPFVLFKSHPKLNPCYQD